MRKKTKQTIISLMTVAVLLLAVIDAAVLTTRCDFTEDNTYKISKVTKETLRGLEDQARITFYISDKVVQQRPFGRTAIDLVKEIAASSRGRVELEVIDPIKKDIPETDRSLLQEWQLQSSDAKASLSVDLVYSGIVIRYLKKKEVIPLVREHNYQQLEYDIVSRVKKMADDYELKIGLLNTSGRGIDQIRSQEDLFKMGYNVLYTQTEQLYQDFAFQEVSVGERIDNSYTAVVVLGAKEIDEKQLLILDQYMMRGGSVLYITERDELRIDPMNQMMPVSFSAYGDLPLMNYLKYYGVEFESGKLMDPNAKQTLSQMGGGRMGVVPVVFHPKITNANKDYPFHTNFSELNLYWPDALKITEPQSGEGQLTDILLESSKGSAMATNPDPRAIMDPSGGVTSYQMTPEENRQRYPVSVRVYADPEGGEITSFYSSNPLPESGGEDALFDTIVESTDTGQFIVISDTEFISDFAFSDGQNVIVQNLFYLRNVAEYLGGDKELLKVRTKIPGVRTFNKVETEEGLAAVSIIAWLVNVVLIPVSIILFALIWLLVRNKRTGGPATKKIKKVEAGK